MFIPFEFLMKARRLRTWPKKATKTVTKDSSIVLAKRAQSNDAVEGARPPIGLILCPYRGLTMAMISQTLERMVEYIASINIVTDSQFPLPS